MDSTSVGFSLGGDFDAFGGVFAAGDSPVQSPRLLTRSGGQIKGWECL